MEELRKALTTRGLTLIAIGACIGSGIFLTPADSARHLPHHGYILLTWMLGGIVSYFGAMTFSELGSLYPREGGVYVYLKNAYGELTGFLYGWIILLIVNTGALAALGMALAGYISFFTPVSPDMQSIIALAVIWGLTVINIFGINISQGFAGIFTGLKLLAILVIIVIGLHFLPGAYGGFSLSPFHNIPADPAGGILLTFVGVFWSMGGWHHATYIAGEAINPARTVPRAMLYATLSVTAVYLLVILACMSVLSLPQMAASEKLAGDAMGAVFDWGGKMVSVMITISIFGTIGIYTMTAPRIYYAMARDGIFFNFLSHISPRFRTPYKAMLFQAAWASVLIMLWGSFSKLITFVTFMDIVFMALATASLFIYRKRKMSNPGYRLLYFPAVPLIYLAVTISFVINTLLMLRTESMVGVLILLAGVPVYYFFKRRKNKAGQSIT